MNFELFPTNLKELNRYKEEKDRPIPYPSLPRNTAKEFNGRYIRDCYCSLEECLSDPATEKFCLDVGALNLFGTDPFEFIVGMGDRLKVVILRDNNGLDDEHMLPFTSIRKGVQNLDWASVFRGLNAIHFDGTLVLDCWDSLRAQPVLFRKAYLEYIASLEEYIRYSLSMDQLVAKHEKRVLFGAGNMCRNYMLNYGDQYPPLFTCDNNSARWGQSIDGLEIKNPEALKELDRDVAIYICNLYYDEISEQLAAMEIQNPVECFFDEYLPKQHSDRMELWKG